MKKEDFTPDDIYSIVKINLVLPDHTVQTINDSVTTGMIEKMLSKAIAVKGLDCPTDIPDGRLLEITVDGHTKVCGLFVES